MNKKGFTLIELLAVLVILSIIMGIAIPNIVSILDKNKKENYIADGKKFVALAKTEISTRIYKPNANDLAIVSLACVDNQDIEVDPNGNKYDTENSYVAVYLDGDEYKYYVYLVSTDDSRKGLGLVDVDDLDGDGRLKLVQGELRPEDYKTSNLVSLLSSRKGTNIGSKNLFGDLKVDDSVKCYVK